MARRTDVTMPVLPLAAARKAVNDRADDAITDQAFWDLIQDLGGGHFRVNSVERALGTVIDVRASKIGRVSDTASDALQAQSPDGGVETAGDTAASTDGTATTITVADGTPSVTAATPVGTGSGAEPVSYGAMVIAGGATLELASAYSGTVAFAGATGTLKIDNSSSFSGTIAGQLAIGDVIDLTDITAGANATITYSGNNSPGTLTVSDGTHTTNIALQGNYSLANFTTNSAGHGGTLVIDPPTLPPFGLINGSYVEGLNLAWNSYGADFGTGGWGYLADWNAVTSELSTFHNEGVTTVRWWVFGDGRYSPVFNSDGTVSGLNSGFLNDIDHALQIAAADHVKILLTLMDNSMFNFASSSGGVQLGGHANIVTDPTIRQSFMDNALKPLLQHIAASPYKDAVLGYDIINEPEAQIVGGYNGSDFFRGPAQLALGDVQSFVAMAANYIHTYSGGGLATVGSAMPIWTPLWMGLGLDFYEAHYYPWMDFNGPGTGLPAVTAITSDTGVHLDKPVIVGEFPTADTSYGLTDTAVGSAEWYLNYIQSQGYAGALGWSLTAGDNASNWAAFQPVFSDWVHASPLPPPLQLTTPALTTYQKMYGVAPSNAELGVLVQFNSAQYAYGVQIQVQDPIVYVYSALGQALADQSDTGSTAFKSMWGPQAISSDATFAVQSYANVFGVPGTPAQIQHFVDQLNFYKSIYTASGAFGDANQIDLLARGAIYGQMIGVKAENPTAALAAASAPADTSLVGVSAQHDITHDFV
jgi:hypothetical protein